ncbi:hypothetical protein EPN44_14290 [bacterium]|nr:MAG: hypothetical protein EPN44_14290 [bacterium]
MSVTDGEYRLENVVVEACDGSAAELRQALSEVRNRLGGYQRRCVLACDESVAVVERWEDESNLAMEANRVSQAGYHAARRAFRTLLSEHSVVLVDLDQSNRAAAWLSLVQVDQLARALRVARQVGLRPIRAVHGGFAYKMALPLADAAIAYYGDRAVLIVLSQPAPHYERISVEEVIEGEGAFSVVRRLAARIATRVSEMRSGGYRLERLTAVGRHEGLESFVGALRRELHEPVLDVSIADLRNMASAFPADIVARYSPEITAAVGAALSDTVSVEGVDAGVPSVNLLRADSSQSLAVIRETPHLRNGVVAVAASIVIAIATSSAAHAQLARAQSGLPAIQSAIGREQQVAAYADAVEERVSALAAIVQRVDDVRTSAYRRARVATIVLNALPSWASLSELRYTDDGWTIRGYAPDEGHVGTLMSRLRTVDGVSSVTERGVEERGGVVEFAVRMVLR